MNDLFAVLTFLVIVAGLGLLFRFWLEVLAAMIGRRGTRWDTDEDEGAR